MTLEEFLRIMFVTYLGFVGYERYLEVSNQKRCWVRDEFQGRDVHGFFQMTFKSIKNQSASEFFKATRMTVRSFDTLLAMVQDRLYKKSARKPIEPECRLALTLFYLANGDSRQKLAMNFRMGVSTVASILHETCSIICEELSCLYLTGSVKVDWEKYAQDYNEKWNLPNCVGALGAKHIPAGTRYFNYRGQRSIVVLAAANANNNFTAIDIITSNEDEQNDEALSESGLGTLLNAEYALPECCLLPNSNISFPYYFVGEVSYPLKRNLIRPYPGNKLCPKREHFNARLALARRSVENAFGIMCARWKVLLSDFNCTPKNFEKIVTACVILHNFLKEQNDPLYCPQEFADHIEHDELVEGLWRTEIKDLHSYRPLCSNNASREAFALRDQLCMHLNNVQDRVIINRNRKTSYGVGSIQNVHGNGSQFQLMKQEPTQSDHSGDHVVKVENILVIPAMPGHISRNIIPNASTEEEIPQYAQMTTVQDIDIGEYKPMSFVTDQNGIITTEAVNIDTSTSGIAAGQVISIAEININLA